MQTLKQNWNGLYTEPKAFQALPETVLLSCLARLPREDHDAVVAAYYADAGRKSEKNIVYDPHLGLAIEELPPGVTTKSLWELTFYD